MLAGHGVAFEARARKEPRVVWRPLEGAVLRARMAFAWPSSSPHPHAAQLAEIAAAVLQDDGVSRIVPEPHTARPWDVFYDRS